VSYGFATYWNSSFSALRIASLTRRLVGRPEKNWDAVLTQTALSCSMLSNSPSIWRRTSALRHSTKSSFHVVSR
jgi:hypothetical protein